MVQVLLTYIEDHRATTRARHGRLFSFWSGDHAEEVLIATTAALPARFARIFMLSGAADLHFHDLRHEATCRSL
jgi:integrase